MKRKRNRSGRTGERALWICLALILAWPVSALPSTAPDAYEVDDTFEQASLIFLNSLTDQHHNFHREGDEDWVIFYGMAGESYEFQVLNAGSRCDPVLELYDTDGVTLLASIDDRGPGEGEFYSWRNLEGSGAYYLKVRPYDPSVSGEETDYDLRIFVPVGIGCGIVTGMITDAVTKRPITCKCVRIETDGTVSETYSGPKGDYAIVDTAGKYQLTASAKGYKTLKTAITVVESEYSRRTDLRLVPEGGPDLVISGITGPASGKAGGRISLTCTVKNMGQVAAGPFTLGLYLSQDNLVQKSKDKRIRSVKVNGLAAGARVQLKPSAVLPAGTAAGNYYLGAIADIGGTVAESNEGNNGRASARGITIQ